MSRRTRVEQQPRPDVSPLCLCIYRCGSGVLGVAAMTMSEKIEQFFTNRSNSLVPGRTLQNLLGWAPRPDHEMLPLNISMHFGQGAVAGVIRAFMSASGVRGPFADFMFVGIRLLMDQTLENWTGVGALPWTRPADEQGFYILHKAVFALATGFVTDYWIQ